MAAVELKPFRATPFQFHWNHRYTARILRRENGALADFVIELAEFDRQKQYLDIGYASLWECCRRELGLSERAIHYRIAAARALQGNPQLAQDIRDGRICITTLAMLSKVMTCENAGTLIAEAAGKSTRQVEQLVARIDPKPVPADVVRPVTAPPSAPKVQTEVLTETLLRKHLTVDTEYEALLKAARDALSHAKPGASELDILKEGLRLIIKQSDKRKGIVEHPRPDREATDGDIPQSVKRAVWKRDQGRCQWRAADGNVCGSTCRVEFHHRQDRAKGGLGSVSNLTLLCSLHNAFAAKLSYGEELIKARRSRRREAESGTQQAPEELQPRLDFT